MTRSNWVRFRTISEGQGTVGTFSRQLTPAPSRVMGEGTRPESGAAKNEWQNRGLWQTASVQN